MFLRVQQNLKLWNLKFTDREKETKPTEPTKRYFLPSSIFTVVTQKICIQTAKVDKKIDKKTKKQTKKPDHDICL